jgi:SAM-dependent methyltransferase
VKCPTCNSIDSLHALVEIKKYSVFVCDFCKTETTIPLPNEEDLTKAYQSFNAGELSREYFTEYCATATAILKNELYHAGIKDIPAGSRFLDYGCGGGHFVKAAQNLGYCAEGLEVDKESLEFLNKHSLKVNIGTFPSAQRVFAEYKFDVVKSMHVLEHVVSPFEVLGSICDVTESGGIIIISVPDQNSLPSWIKKKLQLFGIKNDEWGFVQPPIHLHGFCAETFSTLGNIFNLDVISIRSSSPLDNNSFPTVPQYWDSLPLQKLVYSISNLTASKGYLTAIYKKRAES